MREIPFRSGLYSVGQILRSESFSFPPVRCHCRCFGAAKSFEFHFVCFVIVMSLFVFFRFFYLSFERNARAWIDTMAHSPYRQQAIWFNDMFRRRRARACAYSSQLLTFFIHSFFLDPYHYCFVRSCDDQSLKNRRKIIHIKSKYTHFSRPIRDRMSKIGNSLSIFRGNSELLNILLPNLNSMS